jgi:hypothetical protein
MQFYTKLLILFVKSNTNDTFEELERSSKLQMIVIRGTVIEMQINFCIRTLL